MAFNFRTHNLECVWRHASPGCTRGVSPSPVERGYVQRFHCPETEQLTASVEGLCQKVMCQDLLNYCIGVGSLQASQNVSTADRAGSLRARHHVVAATKAAQGPLGFVGALCAHTHTARTFEARLGPPRFVNEVWLRCFSAPPFGSPFHPFPFTYTFFPSFISRLPCLHVPSFHSFLSFACTSVRPVACTRTSTFDPGFRSPRSR